MICGKVLKPGQCVSMVCRSFQSSGRLYQTKKNYYDVLGVHPDATQMRIKMTYHDLTERLHEDPYSEEETRKAKERLAELTEAYSILGNVKTRRLYDKGFHVEGIKEPIIIETEIQPVRQSNWVLTRKLPRFDASKAAEHFGIVGTRKPYFETPYAKYDPELTSGYNDDDMKDYRLRIGVSCIGLLTVAAVSANLFNKYQQGRRLF